MILFKTPRARSKCTVEFRISTVADNSLQSKLEVLMKKQMNEAVTKSRSRISCFIIVVLLVAMLGAHPVNATTYISVEPIPSRDVVGQNALTMILSVGYP